MRDYFGFTSSSSLVLLFVFFFFFLRLNFQISEFEESFCPFSFIHDLIVQFLDGTKEFRIKFNSMS